MNFFSRSHWHTGDLFVSRVAIAACLVLASCSTRVQTENELTRSTGTPSTQQNPTTYIPPSTPTYEIPNNTTTTNVPITTGGGYPSGTTYPTTAPLECELMRDGGTFWVGQPVYWYLNTNTGEPVVVEDIILSTPWNLARLQFFNEALGITFYTPGEKWLQFYFRSQLDPNRKCNGGAALVDHIFINGY